MTAAAPITRDERLPGAVSGGDSDDTLLEKIQHEAFGYFIEHGNPGNGLICDSTMSDAPASIAVVGFALSGYPVAVERGWMQRSDALARTLAALRFFHDADQSGAVDGIGHHGFFYHFLDMHRGRRAWASELSTIDTTLLVAGMLVAARYFDHDDAEEREVRAKAAAIYERVDWRWAQNGGRAPTMGWTPEHGFLRYRWIGYNEALILYVLALGSPSHPLQPDAYAQWLSGFRWKRIYGHAHVYAGPLFIHQFSQIWIDCRGLKDAYMAPKNIDYFENSRRATYVHHEYASRNPKRFEDYHGRCWGLTASDGPGPAKRIHHGRKRKFYDYRARGAPFGPDDGTVAPWAAIASLPFAPELVMPMLHYLSEQTGSAPEAVAFDFYTSFNPTYHVRRGDAGWVSRRHYGLHQGPMVLMIENYRNGLLWRLMRESPPVVRGLRRAGFTGGWLDLA
jgi:hypothetical protein